MLPDNTGLPAPVSPETPAQVTPAETAGNEPKYVTTEEAQRMAQEAEEKAFRRSQSLVDQSNTRLAKTINEQVEAIKKGMSYTGQTLTPEQEKQIRQQVTLETVSALPPESPPASQPPQAGADNADWINATAARIAAEVGGFSESDPEVKLIKTNGTPDEYLASVFQSKEAKKARIASAQTRTSLPAAGIPAAGFVSGGNPADSRSSRDLISEGLKD